MSAATGAGTLIRLGLRRDRIILPVWLYAIAGLTIVTAVAFIGLYPTVPARLAFGQSLAGNPALLALTGPIFDSSSIGGLTAWRMGSLGGVLIGLASTLTVVRHTRAEEQEGRLELIGAGVVGRHAPLTAAVLLTGLVDLVIGLVAAVGLIATGQPAAGSFAFGLSLAGVGLVFAAVAAVAAQLTESSRAANGIAASVLGATFLLRAIGDSAAPGGPRWLSWLSPISWGEQVRPFAGNHWWLFAPLLGCAALLLAGAFALARRRDLGAGLIPPRPGPATATPGLRTVLALGWRLHRGALIGWAVGFAVFGGVFGGIAQDVASLLNSSPQMARAMEQMGGAAGVVDSFLAAMYGLLGLVASIYTVQAALRLRGEETGLRAEPLLATSVSRSRWAASHIVFAALGPVVLLAISGVTAGLADGLRTGEVGRAILRGLAGTLVQVPAVWVLAGLTVALFGLAPKVASVAWAVVVVFLLLGQFGPILRLPQWAMDISPFTHVPKLPGGIFEGAPMGWLCLIAIGATAAGLAGFRRRDLG
ncbi:MAG TPA: ABC transporter permease [Pseudonocardiaceae bacterium]|jgi:ABC-2 type transport system permease protein|nr:ABC transporter permease [Pseudonocardiaceae bacterium]